MHGQSTQMCSSVQESFEIENTQMKGNYNVIRRFSLPGRTIVVEKRSVVKGNRTTGVLDTNAMSLDCDLLKSCHPFSQSLGRSGR